MSYSNLVTVRRICVSDGVVPLDHLSPKKKPLQVKTEVVKRQVLAECSVSSSSFNNARILSLYVGEGGKTDRKAQEVAAKKNIIHPPAEKPKNANITRTQSGNFTDIVKSYWEKAGAMQLEEAIENIPPDGLKTYSPALKEKICGMKNNALKKSSISAEALEELNNKKVGGFLEDSDTQQS